MTLDLERITHPLRLAKGSHQPGSGKGCAMNVISYINGDVEITDYPECSARPLAALVQSCNDELSGFDGFLTPKNSLIALELGWQTVGTADVPDAVINAWIAEVLVNPDWGVLKYAKDNGTTGILNVAGLHRKAAQGDLISSHAWLAAWSALEYASSHVCRSENSAANSAHLFAIKASRAAVKCGPSFRPIVDIAIAVARFAVRSASTSTAQPPWFHISAAGYVEFSQQAISSWRKLAGLDKPTNVNAKAVDLVLERIGIR